MYTTISTVGILVFGNLPVLFAWLRTVAPIRIGESLPSLPSILACGALESGDMQGIVTQCLAVLGAVAITLFAAPQSAARITVGAMSGFRWVEVLRDVAAITAGVANGVAIAALLSLVARANGSTDCSVQGVAFPIGMLAIVGNMLAIAAVKPGNQAIADAVAWGETWRLQERRDRVISALGTGPAHGRVGKRSPVELGWKVHVAVALTYVVNAYLSSLLAALLVMMEFSWMAVLETGTMLMFLYSIGAVFTSMFLVAGLGSRWTMISRGKNLKVAAVFRWLFPTLPMIGLVLIFAGAILAAMASGLSAEQQMYVALLVPGLFILPSISACLWLFLADTMVGRRTASDLDVAIRRARPNTPLPLDAILPVTSAAGDKL